MSETPTPPDQEPTPPAAEKPPRTSGLEPTDRAIVEDELEMAARVQRRIAKSLQQADTPKTAQERALLEAELVSLRDQIGEARGEDVPALLAQMMRVAAVAQMDGPKAQGMVDPNTPYFGHMRLKEDGRSRDVLIGKRAMVDRQAGVVIVDWRNAPVSRLYYRYDEGDEYEEELGEQVREGEVLVRRTVSFKKGALTRVASPDGTFIVKDADGEREWVALPKLDAPELKGGVGTAARAPRTEPPKRGRLGHVGAEHLRPDKHLPEIAALIDRAQFEAMTQPDAGVVVLQGGAGSGKTTVALHRIAWLCFAARDRFRPKRVTVVVRQPALVRYVERVLPSLDVAGVRVQAYDSFARFALQRILPRLDRRTIHDAPAEVSRLKKHPGMLDAIRRQVARRAEEAEQELAKVLEDKPGKGRVMADWRAREGVPLLPRLEELLASLRNLAVPEDTRERARRALERVLKRARDIESEWEELITDRELLGSCTSGYPALDERTLTNALAWTKRQIEEPDLDEDVDPSARRPVDGRSGIDEDDPVGALDPHDLPVLLNMWIARTGGLFAPGPRGSTQGKELRYDHIAVDEAQDLSAVEIFPLLVAAGPRRSLTLAGDIVQKVVFDNGFEDWETLLEQLGTEGTRVEPFRLTYRSTSEVVELAREVLGPLAPEEPPRAVRSGAPVEAFHFEDTGEEIAFLAENLRSVMGREPNASVAVLTRYPERARFFARLLEDAEVPRLRLVDGPDAVTFAPGVDVTHIAQVKGLEYDYVVLCEANAATYPDEVAARHLLHIGATRAAHQLWITSSGSAPSVLIPQHLFQG